MKNLGSASCRGRLVPSRERCGGPRFLPFSSSLSEPLFLCGFKTHRLPAENRRSGPACETSRVEILSTMRDSETLHCKGEGRLRFLSYPRNPSHPWLKRMGVGEFRNPQSGVSLAWGGLRRAGTDAPYQG